MKRIGRGIYRQWGLRTQLRVGVAESRDGQGCAGRGMEGHGGAGRGRERGAVMTGRGAQAEGIPLTRRLIIISLIF